MLYLQCTCVPIYILDASWLWKKIAVAQKLEHQPWMVLHLTLVLPATKNQKRYIYNLCKIFHLGVWMKFIGASWAQYFVFVSYEWKKKLTWSIELDSLKTLGYSLYEGTSRLQYLSFICSVESLQRRQGLKWLLRCLRAAGRYWAERRGRRELMRSRREEEEEE